MSNNPVLSELEIQEAELELIEELELIDQELENETTHRYYTVDEAEHMGIVAL